MPNPLENTQVHLVNETQDAEAFFTWLSTKSRVAIDTETTGLRPEIDRVRLVQVGDPDQGWAIRTDLWAGVVIEMTKRYKGEYVGHNLKFDMAMLRSSFGVQLPIARCHDTRILAHIMEPDLMSGLKAVAARHIHPSAATMDRQLAASFKAQGWTWETVPYEFEPYWAYGALDAVLTARVFDLFYQRVMEEAPRAYELELAAQWVLERMERTGVHIDTSTAHANLTKINDYVAQVEAWTTGTYGIKPGANADVIRVLGELGYEFDKKTKSGAMSLDKEVLGSIQHPLAQAVLNRRQGQKIASTYLTNFLRDVGTNGRLHPSINPLGARTGRMSMSEPNFQNLPRVDGNPFSQLVRDCVIAPEGKVLISCDFDQIEMRVLAHLADDQAMREAFAGDVDFFTMMARGIYQDAALVKSDPRRQLTKNAGYAKAYGAGAEKFGLTAGISTEAAASFMDRMDVAYPGIRKFQDFVTSIAKERLEIEGRAYVRSPMTRRPQQADPGKEYTLINYLIQGMAAEVFKMKLVELDLAGLGPYLILPIHDEVILDVPTEDAEEHLRVVESVMNDDQLLSVPITASGQVAERWGAMKK